MIEVIFIFILAIFEAVVWIADPFKVHQALNQGESIGLYMKIISVLVNSVPIALIGVSLIKKWLKPLIILMPYLIVFTCMQTFFWWWPYLLGNLTGADEMIKDHKEELKDLPRILPKIGDNLVPDIEHTILFPISVFSLYFGLNAFRNLKFEIEGKKCNFRNFTLTFNIILGVLSLITINNIMKTGIEQQIGYCLALLCMQIVQYHFVGQCKLQQEQYIIKENSNKTNDDDDDDNNKSKKMKSK